jgi:hypothetical protein
VQGRQALRSAGYRVRVDEALGTLDLTFYPYLAGFEAGRELELFEQGRDDVEVLGAVHFRDHDRVEPFARLFYYLDQVAVEMRRVERVGAVECRPAAPVELLYGPGDLCPGARLLVRGDCVLQVEKD